MSILTCDNIFSPGNSLFFAESLKADRSARIVEDTGSQEETLALPTGDDSGRPPTPVTVRHVDAGDGGLSKAGSYIKSDRM